MAQLRENLDLVAIMVLIAMLGLGPRPRLALPERVIHLEPSAAKLRMLRLNIPAHPIPFTR